MKKTAVVLFNLGGPDSLKAVRPFLYNLFSDRDIFKIPFGQKLFAYILSTLRTATIKKSYALIGGKSPINEWTEKQRAMLEMKLQTIDVYTGMRYWKPSIREAAQKIRDKKYERIILLPLYPHFSLTTTGSSYNEWNRVFKNDSNTEIVVIHEYATNPYYIQALNEPINEALLKFPQDIRNKVQLVFSAHGTPISLVKQGDPYSRQINETIQAIMKYRNYSHEYHLCYQSKIGPIKWLGPSIGEMIGILANKNKKNLLIIPISFVSDHIETLYELDILYRKTANLNGIENYVVINGLNDSDTFITALTNIVLSKV